MSRKVSQVPLPWAYEGLGEDPAHWRDLGYDVVVHGEPLTIHGVDLPPLWRWFDRANNPYTLRILRFGCARCSTPVAEVKIVRDEPGVGEPVAAVTYQQSARVGLSREVVVRRALLHLPAPGGACRHGPLVAHVDDVPVTTFCRGCGPQLVPWEQVTAAIERAGGWEVTEDDLRSTARRRLVRLR